MGAMMSEDIKDEVIKEESDYSFIQEKIKDRPINRKKLVRKMILTGGLAIIFGLVACMTFIFLEPLFGKMVNKEDNITLEHVVIPEVASDDPDDITVIISDQPIDDTSFEEKSIEDMPLTDDDMTSIIGTAAVSGNQVSIIEEPELELEDYRLLYRKLYVLSTEVEKSIVAISEKPSISDQGEINLNSAKTYGIIVGDNGYELLVLADSNRIKNVDNLNAKFCNDDTVDATVKRIDPETGFGIYAIKLLDLKSTTMSEITYVTLGSSSSSTLNGSPVVAVGNPMNYGDSVCYGAITSSDMVIQKADSTYQVLTTDIYADKEANGFLINVRGQVVGVITSDGHPDGMQNLIYAYGISAIRNLIEDLANDEDISYIGVYAMDVTDEAKNELGVPIGAYVTKVESGSPAMNVGIIPGDVIIGVEDISITNVNVYTQCLRNHEPGSVVSVRVMRYSAGEYKEMSVDITTESRTDKTN